MRFNCDTDKIKVKSKISEKHSLVENSFKQSKFQLCGVSVVFKDVIVNKYNFSIYLEKENELEIDAIGNLLYDDVSLIKETNQNKYLIKVFQAKSKDDGSLKNIILVIEDVENYKVIYKNVSEKQDNVKKDNFIKIVEKLQVNIN